MNSKPIFYWILLTVAAGHSSARCAEPPTFSTDVARIVFDNCTTCHRPGSSGPFSLLTYDDVRSRSATIGAVLEEDYMPPWKPIDHGIAFANSRDLSVREQKTIMAWIEAGCPQGDAEKTPAPPHYPDGWSVGTPDLVIQMNGEYSVPAEGPDIYRSFVFPLNLPEDKWVKAVELRPRARSAVHHAIFFLDTERVGRKIDGSDGEVGIEGMSFLSSFSGPSVEDGSETSLLRSAGTLLNRLRGSRRPEEGLYQTTQQLNRGLGGYVPGAMPNLLPGDLAMPLPRGSDIVMQTHFHPSGKPETEQAELALYFADRPPSRPMVPIMVPAMFGFGTKLRVPAGENQFRLSDSVTLPVDTQAIGVSGHAHYLCRTMKMTATLPGQESTVLLHIEDWDLDWQDQYLFAEPVNLPAGTVLRTELVYDNSAGNPRNPFDPPRDIRWGRGSNDEMGSVTLLTVSQRQQDHQALQSAVRQYVVGSLVPRKSSDLVEMLMQLDDNHDGMLQPTETPPRFDKRLFGFFDTNNDGGLHPTELQPLARLRGGFLRRGQDR